MSFIERLFRVEERALAKLKKEADRVLAFAEAFKQLTDDQLKEKTGYFKKLLSEGQTLSDIKYEAFAVAREAATRTLKMTPFPVQIIGALVLHEGNVAEMRTGEGKTLTATMAVYLNALAGKGVHVVTVNEYLAKRDAEWMGAIYTFLGLTVGVNLREKDTKQKQEAFKCDITYTTNAEVGFDYLRDNMASEVGKRVLRTLDYAIVDEADSILIDESRTPLIISGGARSNQAEIKLYDSFVKMLKKEQHFTIDPKTKTCVLTDAGSTMAELAFKIKNLYSPEHQEKVHRIHQALKANFIMQRNVDYLVDGDNNIQIIDQFTGRILKGREFSDGLHQAIQAKENAKFRAETITMATITYQNFFRLYQKLSGMTGTAKTEEEEFHKIYNMKVIAIPTNVPVIRDDAVDFIYATKAAKQKAIIQEVKTRWQKKQPILIGTTSVESSEEFHILLQKEGIPHSILNAKNHEFEAEIIRRAGEAGSVTLATNMAGRGTDIKLGAGVRELGGLCVIGTERHEARRIDNQLRGRAGRQGDPGFSRFFVSLEDELMIRFGSENLKNFFKSLGDQPLEHPMVMNAITSAQKRIEGQNFDVRKTLLDYDNVLATQRRTMYAKRDKILLAEDIKDLMEETFLIVGRVLAKKSILPEDRSKSVSGALLKKLAEPNFVPAGTIVESAYQDSPLDEVAEDLALIMLKRLQEKFKPYPTDVVRKLQRQHLLRIIDMNWPRHIDAMDHLRQGISLRSYGQTDPIQEYVSEGLKMFQELNEKIATDYVVTLLNANIEVKLPPLSVPGQPTAIATQPASAPASEAPKSPTPNPKPNGGK